LPRLRLALRAKRNATIEIHQPTVARCGQCQQVKVGLVTRAQQPFGIEMRIVEQANRCC